MQYYLSSLQKPSRFLIIPSITYSYSLNLFLPKITNRSVALKIALLFFYLLPDQVPYSLQLLNIIKSIFGYQKKRAGVKIQVKKMRGLQKITESCPGPCLGNVLGTQFYPFFLKTDGKMVPERGLAFVNAGRQNPPYDRHEGEPQKGK